MSIAIFRYISSHLDAEGRFTESHLPDDPNPTVPRPFGAEDAFYYTTDFPANPKGAKRTITLLRAFLKNSTIENRQKLYKHLSAISVSTICDPFADEFGIEDNDQDVLEFARALFYHANHREPFKFAIVLFGIYGMDRIQKDDSSLWQDIVTAAHCEEFTFFFFFACRISELYPDKEIWQIIDCTNGWGKVYAINEIKTCKKEQQLLLVQKSIDITVEYPPLAIQLLRVSHLLNLLKEDTIDYETYKGAAAILTNILRLLNDFPAPVLEENFTISTIDVYAHLEALLKHAAQYCDEPDDVLDIIGISIGLRTAISNENWQRFTPNQLHILLSECEYLIFQKDWSEEIASRLIENNVVNYSLCDLAYELDIDIWDRLFKYWCQHPKEIRLFPFLLAYEDDNRALTVISGIEKNILLYWENADDLLIPLRYLRSHPGEGIGIVIAALTSAYDWPRGVATSLLEEWGQEYITPLLREKLWEARKLSMHPIVTARIDSLLRGEIFNLQALTEHMDK